MRKRKRRTRSSATKFFRGLYNIIRDAFVLVMCWVRNLFLTVFACAMVFILVMGTDAQWSPNKVKEKADVVDNVLKGVKIVKNIGGIFKL